jgi:bifunctional lysine-specific demethylase and histidyl-hydroxylase NO66
VHDVFVLQVSGRKRWRLHEPVVPDPLDNQNWEKSRAAVAARAEQEPVLDTVLEPGDALYLPRGTIHAAEALGETSIHLTVGVHPVTRYTLVQRLLELAQDDPALRSSLPMGVDLDDPAVLAGDLEATVAALRDFLGGVSAPDLARGIGDRLRQQTRPEPLAPLAQLAAAHDLEPRTPLRLRPALRTRVEDDGDHIAVIFLDRRVQLPASAADAIKTITSAVPFTAAELPGLSADDQLAVARRLLREGVIVPG